MPDALKSLKRLGVADWAVIHAPEGDLAWTVKAGMSRSQASGFRKAISTVPQAQEMRYVQDCSTARIKAFHYAKPLSWALPLPTAPSADRTRLPAYRIGSARWPFMRKWEGRSDGINAAGPYLRARCPIWRKPDASQCPQPAPMATPRGSAGWPERRTGYSFGQAAGDRRFHLSGQPGCPFENIN